MCDGRPWFPPFMIFLLGSFIIGGHLKPTLFLMNKAGTHSRAYQWREHRVCDGWQAMPIFEQNTPSGPLPQERQPSVHAVQLAFGPVANSSSRVSVPGLDMSGWDVSALGCGCPACRGMTARSAANVNSVPRARPGSPVSATMPTIAVQRRSDIGLPDRSSCVLIRLGFTRDECRRR